MSGTFVWFALCFIFKGAYAWWAAAARGIEPIILSFGAAFAAFGLKDQPNHDIQLFNRKIQFEKKEPLDKDYKGTSGAKKEEPDSIHTEDKCKKNLHEAFTTMTP